jgi:hypothetical protein
MNSSTGTEGEFTMINLKEVQSLSVSLIVNLKRVEYHFGETATEKLVELLTSRSEIDFGKIPLPVEITKSLFAGQMIGKVTKDRVTLEDGSTLAWVIYQGEPSWVSSVAGPVREPKTKKSVVTVPVTPELETTISLHTLSL